MAKTGQIVAAHWAHIASDDCDSWAEPDSEWHRDWQALAGPDRCEVPFVREEGDRIVKHLADILTPDGVVVEIQDSSIPVDQIQIREQFYGEMVWIFNAIEPFEESRLRLYARHGYQAFRWEHPRKSLGMCNKPVLLDFGSDLPLFRIMTIDIEAPCMGWGFLVDREKIIDWFTNLSKEEWSYERRATKDLDRIASSEKRQPGVPFFTRDDLTHCWCGQRVIRWGFDHPRFVECPEGEEHKRTIDPLPTRKYTSWHDFEWGYEVEL